MKRTEVFEAIERERTYQDDKWGSSFDDRNTPNDWVSFIAIYLGKAVTLPFDREAFRTAVLKIAALAVAILEYEEYAPRHYDVKGASN